MYCINCGTQLPQEANACPSCGAASPLFHASANSSPNASTAAPSQDLKSSKGADVAPVPTQSEVPSPSLVQQKPATYYGSQPHYPGESNPYAGSGANPYAGSESNPYGASSPYRTDTPPPPPSTPRRKNRVVYVVALCVVLLALISTGAFIFVTKSSPSSTLGSSQATVTPSQTVQQNKPTSPSEKQAFYDQTIGTAPLVNDPLSGPDNLGLDNYTGQGGNTRCFFSQGQFHSVAQPGYFSPCYARTTNYQDFVLQVKMTIISGHSGGLAFRANYTNDKGYQFRISTDGTYILNRIILDQQGRPIADGETVVSGSSPLVQQGTNQLGIMAQGDTIALFINGKYVDSGTDSTYYSGQVGVYVDSDASSVEGTFSNLQVWKLV